MPATSLSTSLPPCTFRGEQPSCACERFDAPLTSGRRLTAAGALVTRPMPPSGRAGVRAPTGSTRSRAYGRGRPSPRRGTESELSGPRTAGTSAWDFLFSWRAVIDIGVPPSPCPFPLRWNACGTAEVIRLIFAPGRDEYDEDMSETVVRAAGLGIAIVYASLIAWLFVRQPTTFAEVTGGLSSAVGVYRIDQQAFDDGLRYFRNDQFAEARAAFERADPARRDALTQFYIGYTFYREGWGRFYSDDRLYREGLEAVNRAIALAPRGGSSSRNRDSRFALRTS